MTYISSPQNSSIKELIKLLDKSRNRRKEGQFVIEGQREISLALKAKYNIHTLYFCEALVAYNDIKERYGNQINIVEISKEVYEKVAYRSSTEGVIALAYSKPHNLEALRLSKNPLILVAEAPEKPGNIGALLRTADAANLDAVIIANPKTDLYNPNIIRSSVGCVFTNQVAMAHTTEVISFLKRNNIAIYCALLQTALPYHTQDYTTPSALVVGTEATGLTEEWRQASTQNIIIPMQGEIDSMNVSVAAGILTFEAKRQRGF